MAIDLDSVLKLLAWVGASTILAIVAWFAKLPQKAWNRFVLWVVFRHGKLPRRAILFVVKRAEWHFASVDNKPATQLDIVTLITNLTLDYVIVFVAATFRPSWSWRRPLKLRYPLVHMHNFGEAIPAKTVAPTTIHGFGVPRIEDDNHGIVGTLTLVDQFHNTYKQRITVMPGGDVAGRVEIEKGKRHAEGTASNSQNS